MSILALEEADVFYGKAQALQRASIAVGQGEIVSLIGRNGAGKSTTLKAAIGLAPLRAGRRVLGGQDVTGLKPSQLARRGIAFVPEDRRIFTELTVLENLRVGAIHRRDKDGIEQDIARMQTLFPKLSSRAKQAAGTLSGGEQQMLAIARALMMRPKMLLLDEPSFGIAPRVTQEIYELLHQLRETEHLTALIVEQNAQVALNLVNRAYVLESGRVTAQGTAAELREDDAVRRSYLGH